MYVLLTILDIFGPRNACSHSSIVAFFIQKRLSTIANALPFSCCSKNFLRSFRSKEGLLAPSRGRRRGRCCHGWSSSWMSWSWPKNVSTRREVIFLLRQSASCDLCHPAAFREAVPPQPVDATGRLFFAFALGNGLAKQVAYAKTLVIVAGGFSVPIASLH
jgi:hypothetical protein